MVGWVALGLEDPQLVPMVQLVPVVVHLVHTAPRAHLAFQAQATLVLYLASSHNYPRHHNILHIPQSMLVERCILGLQQWWVHINIASHFSNDMA